MSGRALLSRKQVETTSVLVEEVGGRGARSARRVLLCVPTSSGLPPNFLCRLVLAETDVNCVSQEVVGGPGQIGNLGDDKFMSFLLR
jgi:hypothetical protein